MRAGTATDLEIDRAVSRSEYEAAQSNRVAGWQCAILLAALHNLDEEFEWLGCRFLEGRIGYVGKVSRTEGLASYDA